MLTEDARIDSGTTVARGLRHARIDRRAWLSRAGAPLLVLLYVCLWGASGLPHINVTDLDAFFIPSARIAAAGHPLAVYSVRFQGAYPTANGPVSLVPLTAVVWIAERLGLIDDPSLRRMLVMAAFALFTLLMSREVLLASDRLLARPLDGWRRLLAYALVTLSPELWHSVLFYGHIEQPIMLWLVLAAVRALAERRAAKAGLLLGLALLARSAAVMYVIPLVLLLLWRRRWRAAVTLAGATAAMGALGLLPFWLADRADVTYSLFSFRALLPIGGGTIWRLTLGTALQPIGEQHDSIIVVGLAVLLCLVVLRARRDLDVASRDVYALLALCGLCFPLFIKALWPYYFLEEYVLFCAWWLAGKPSGGDARAWALWWTGLLAPAAMIGCAQLGEYGVTSFDNGLWSVPLSLTMFGAIVAVMVALLLALCWKALGRALVRLASPYGRRDIMQA